MVLEIIYGNEGRPGCFVFLNKADAKACAARLREENGKDNDGVLIVRCSTMLRS